MEIWLDTEQESSEFLVKLSAESKVLSHEPWRLTSIEVVEKSGDAGPFVALIVGCIERLVIEPSIIGEHAKRTGKPWPTAIWVPPRQNLTIGRAFQSRNNPNDMQLRIGWDRA
jgi:hypothetical protein